MNSENDNLGFVYSFDMSKEIVSFKSLSDDIQSKAESSAVEVIYESFVVPGDHDYLMSRLLAQNGLPRGFYWAAAQAIEKYLKAFLLMNSEGVKKYQAHPIKELFKAACKIDTSLAIMVIMPHQSIEVEACYSSFLEKFTIQSFMNELEKYGHANNRYNAFGVDYNTGHLCAMDSLSFQLRNKIGAIPIDNSFRYLSNNLMDMFEKNNPWFSSKENLLLKKIPSEDFPMKSSSNITKLEWLIKCGGNPADSIALQWLNAKMKLPKPPPS